MIRLDEILKNAVIKRCSDIYLSVGAKVFGRINSKLEVIFNETLRKEDTLRYAKEILLDSFDELDKKCDMDISFSISGIGRFRSNVFKQRNSVAIAIKLVSLNNSDNMSEYFIPERVFEYISLLNKGLVLITGPSSSGKSTTIFSIIEKMSKKFPKHIITIESPIEILHQHNNSVINQREVGSDTRSYMEAIKAAFKETPDILVIDNIIDYDILKMIFKCCDAGMLVISSIYSHSVTETICNLMEMDSDNSINFKNILSNILECVVSQKIVLDNNDNKLCLFEIMFKTQSISNCIRENKLFHIETLLRNNSKLGMCTLDMALIEAYKLSKISKSIFLQNISNKELAAKIILNY